MSPHRVSFVAFESVADVRRWISRAVSAGVFSASAHPSQRFTDADRSQDVHEFERAVDHASDRRPARGVFDRRTTP
jgi:hypothetical protein